MTTRTTSQTSGSSTRLDTRNGRRLRAYNERKLPDGTTLVTAPMPLPGGWNRDLVTVEFVLPVPYPNAQPDCFYADAELRLANGDMPSNTGHQVLDGQARLWFSWHVTSWNPAVDNIHSYLRFIESRLRDAR